MGLVHLVGLLERRVRAHGVTHHAQNQAHLVVRLGVAAGLGHFLQHGEGFFPALFVRACGVERNGPGPFRFVFWKAAVIVMRTFVFRLRRWEVLFLQEDAALGGVQLGLFGAHRLGGGRGGDRPGGFPLGEVLQVALAADGV
jgi:hypothetical protein